MKLKQYNEELFLSQKNVREYILFTFKDFEFSSLQSIIEKEKDIIPILTNLKTKSKGFREEEFFSAYCQLLLSIFHLLKFAYKELDGEISNHLKAAKTNVRLINVESLEYIYGFKNDIENLRSKILSVKEVIEIKTVINEFIKIPFPFVSEFPVQRSFTNKEDFQEEMAAEKEQKIVLSFSLFIENEPWPNPKILKPETHYMISGKIKLNSLPSGFDKLTIKPYSTIDDSWFVFSIPFIQLKKDIREYEIDGNVIFKYPQSSIDDNISIKLLAYFENGISKLYPIVIGYDQLILKVIDSNSFPFITGFKMMNKAVFNIWNTINDELPEVDKKEKKDFLNLLSGILNYQGFSIQQGIYKGINSKTEENFRDELIQHLIGLPYIGENIIKEPHIAGGRVEISYHGIITELKVETKISDRKKMIKKYTKQPVAYASGNLKQLSILCILDLTEKRNPPANPLNNIQFISPEVHGFNSEDLEYVSKVAVLFIDGNTKKPSDYSK